MPNLNPILATHSNSAERFRADIGIERPVGIRLLLSLTTARFCSVPDTAPQLSGLRILDYGTPIGRWSRGNLKVGVLLAGFKGMGVPSPNPQAVAMSVYGLYQALTPFFSFTFVPANSAGDITVRFGTTPASFGALGLGDPPESGNLELDTNTTWPQSLLFSIMLHEAGHTLGLSHSTNPNSVMYPFAPFLNVLDAETTQAIRSMYDWTPQKPLLDRASTHGPSLAVLTQVALDRPPAQQVYMAWKGTEGDSSLYFSQSSDGLNWTSQTPLPGVGSSEGPCLAAFHPPSSSGFPLEGLFMAWKGVEDDHNIYWSKNPDLTGWSDQKSVSVGTSARPALVEFNRQMILAWKGLPGDSGIYWSKFDGVDSWSPQKRIVGRGTSSSPVLVVFLGQLHMFWKGIEDDSNVYHAVLVDVANGIWGPQQPVAFTDSGELDSGETPVFIGTSDGPATTVRGNELVLVWKGIPGDHTLWFSRMTSATFAGQISIPNAGSKRGPAIANLNGRLVAAWRGIGDDHGIWVATLG